jgi:DNA polymerase-3 subunit alpha
MVRDKEGNPIAGFEMNDMEALGHVKFDILGVTVLDKLMDMMPFLPEGKSVNNFDDEVTWDLLSEGDTKGVFQLETQKRWTKKLLMP